MQALQDFGRWCGRFLEEKFDKLMLLALVLWFGHLAISGGVEFAQRLCDGFAGAILTLIVQRAKSTAAPEAPPAPGPEDK